MRGKAVVGVPGTASAGRDEQGLEKDGPDGTNGPDGMGGWSVDTNIRHVLGNDA